MFSNDSLPRQVALFVFFQIPCVFKPNYFFFFFLIGVMSALRHDSIIDAGKNGEISMSISLCIKNRNKILNVYLNLEPRLFKVEIFCSDVTLLGDPDYALVEGEAERVAKQAVRIFV